MRRFFLLTASVLSLSACAVGPDYERPALDTPDSFKEAGAWQKAEPSDAIDRGAWWSVYQDPILDDLEKQVLVSNQNLKAAEAAYRAAVAAADQTRATLFPTVDVSGSGTKSGKAGRGQPTSYNVSANASWTVDVWGRIRRSVEADDANAEASAADLASAMLSAQAQLATAYFDIRMQDELKKLLDSTVEADKKILQITTNQYQAGITSKADVLAAQTQLESLQAQAINADVSRATLEHAIAVLTGKAPAGFFLPPDTSKHYRIPNIPAEMPSVLLQRRPDIASAERVVIAANAEVGVAEGAWFPNITLSASFGYAATMLGKLAQASTSLWSFGPTIAETIFDAGARAAAVEQAEATYDESVANYRQITLTAFQQVEDNLSTLRILGEQSKAQSSAVANARKSEQLTLNQYKEGIVPFNTVLTAETVRLSNEQSELSVQRSRLEASVALIQALGGGWDVGRLSASGLFQEGTN
jgi:NodT family efflux transporter outer membrane factor (OMF) lipoprotein